MKFLHAPSTDLIRGSQQEQGCRACKCLVETSTTIMQKPEDFIKKEENSRWKKVVSPLMVDLPVCNTVQKMLCLLFL